MVSAGWGAGVFVAVGEGKGVFVFVGGGGGGGGGGEVFVGDGGGAAGGGFVAVGSCGGTGVFVGVGGAWEVSSGVFVCDGVFPDWEIAVDVGAFSWVSFVGFSLSACVDSLSSPTEEPVSSKLLGALLSSVGPAEKPPIGVNTLVPRWAKVTGSGSIRTKE
ncbi:MAG: hypothetical protein ACXADB_10880 [Candidatus Hermodarchaeia archaeon]